MRDNLYITAILICTCVLLLAGLAFTALELWEYEKSDGPPSSPPAREETTSTTEQTE